MYRRVLNSRRRALLAMLFVFLGLGIATTILCRSVVDGAVSYVSGDVDSVDIRATNADKLEQLYGEYVLLKRYEEESVRVRRDVCAANADTNLSRRIAASPAVTESFAAFCTATGSSADETPQYSEVARKLNGLEASQMLWIYRKLGAPASRIRTLIEEFEIERHLSKERLKRAESLHSILTQAEGLPPSERRFAEVLGDITLERRSMEEIKAARVTLQKIEAEINAHQDGLRRVSNQRLEALQVEQQRIEQGLWPSRRNAVEAQSRLAAPTGSLP